METENRNFDTLIRDFFDYLKSIPRSEKTIKLYAWAYRKVKLFMDDYKIENYDEETEKEFLSFYFSKHERSQLSPSGKRFANTIRVLTIFQKTGAITFGTKKDPPKVFDGTVGATMADFIAYKKQLFQFSPNDLKDYISYLHQFLTFLKEENVTSFDGITLPLVLRYIECLDPQKLPKKNRILLIVKSYLRYLCEQKYLSRDFSFSIPKGASIHRPQVPSTFTTEEIKTVLNAVDRGSRKGKRDYAILLLAVQLGIRSSDIQHLQFESLLWQQQKISLVQQKTGRQLVLPLLPEVGNAIIEYLQHGRPVSTESYVFLQLIAPYKPLNRCSVGDIVQYHMERAGITCSGRKHGPHALRHSFAGRLLAQEVPIPVISEALGHSSSETTMDYLRIDVTRLACCALEVAPVPASFYKQNLGGGMCHE